MKLIIQIPCFNEEAQLPADARPRCPARSTGFDAVEWLIIDDGSTDATIEIARRHGVDHIVTPDQPQGAGRRLPGRAWTPVSSSAPT